MTPSQLRDTARSSIRAGDRGNAARLCETLVAIEKNDPFANSFLAFEAMQRGDFSVAVDHGQAACAGNPGDPTLWQNLGLAHFAAGEVEQAIAAYDQGLQCDSAHGLLWLYKGQALQRADRDWSARCFVRAFEADPRLAQAYRMNNVPAAIRDLSRIANEVVRDVQFEQQKAVMENALSMPFARMPDRLQSFLRIFHGLEPNDFGGTSQRPDFQYFPQLTARPFWSSECFPWVQQVESALPMLREEAQTAITRTLTPYVGDHYQADPTWSALAGRQQWSSFHLYKSGRRIGEHCELCPRTDALLQSLPLATIPHHAPEAFFSVLQPRTRIPPHYGISNIKLTVHMPLIVPDGCGIRVDEEQRDWHTGQCMVFDDSFLHEAWNDSDDVRIVLIFEVWNPDLSDEEQAAVAAVTQARHQWLEAARGD